MFSKIAQFQLMLLAALAVLSSSANALEMTPKEVENIFIQYDVEDLDTAPECQSEEIEAAICPKDDRVPCGDMKAIEEHCAAILGEEITKEAQSHETLKGKNAYNGCLTYVSYHVFEFNHIACCESDVCEDWLMDQFDEMFPDEADEEGFVVGDDEIDDDDDDDEYYRDGEEF